MGDELRAVRAGYAARDSVRWVVFAVLAGIAIVTVAI